MSIKFAKFIKFYDIVTKLQEILSIILHEESITQILRFAYLQ